MNRLFVLQAGDDGIKRSKCRLLILIGHWCKKARHILLTHTGRARLLEADEEANKFACRFSRLMSYVSHQRFRPQIGSSYLCNRRLLRSHAPIMTAEIEPQTAVQCWSLLRPAVQSKIATPPQRLTKHCYASGLM